MGSADREEGGGMPERAGLRLGGVALDDEVDGWRASREADESVGIELLDGVRNDVVRAGRLTSRFSGRGGGGGESAAAAAVAADLILGGAMSAEAEEKRTAWYRTTRFSLLAEANMDRGQVMHSGGSRNWLD